MKMLSKIIQMLFAFSVIISIVCAIPMPAPVSGTVTNNGIPVSGYSVYAENTRTGEIIGKESVPSMVTENGKFLFDLGEFDQGYAIRYNLQSGDTIKVRVCDASSKCTEQKFEVVDINPKELNFVINGVVNPPEQCPTCQECVPCQDKDCPSLIWTILLTLVGAGSIGVGVKIAKGKTGVTSIQHIHPGITGYHNPDTVHSNVNIRHPKGEKVPKYEKDITGVWHYKK